VWELDGPMPIFSMSNTLKLMINAFVVVRPLG
jgi:hypothetical protein